MVSNCTYIISNLNNLKNLKLYKCTVWLFSGKDVRLVEQN